jgi:hypothetical protein
MAAHGSGTHLAANPGEVVGLSFYQIPTTGPWLASHRRASAAASPDFVQEVPRARTSPPTRVRSLRSFTLI